MSDLLQAVDAGAVSGAPDYVPLLLAAFNAEQGDKSERHDDKHKILPGTSHSAASPSGSCRPGRGYEEPLTERELEVLRLIASGQSNAEIARTLVIALSTVKTHTNSIFSKLWVASRTQAISRARELRLL